MRNIFSLTNHEVYVLTAAHEGRENGQVATWIMPATLAAGFHRLVAVISRNNFTHGLLAGSGRFGLSLLARAQVDLLPHFGLLSGHDQDKMSGVPLERTPSGLPVLSEAVGWVECEVMDAMEGGDRVVYLADIVHSRLHPDRAPLRKGDALSSLPDAVRQALVQKRVDEGARDAGLIRQR